MLNNKIATLATAAALALTGGIVAAQSHEDDASAASVSSISESPATPIESFNNDMLAVEKSNGGVPAMVSVVGQNTAYVVIEAFHPEMPSVSESAQTICDTFGVASKHLSGKGITLKGISDGDIYTFQMTSDQMAQWSANGRQCQSISQYAEVHTALVDGRWQIV